MTVFGLSERAVTSALDPVRPEHAETERPDEIFARAAWSIVCEPGDGVAGALIANLGAAEALRSVIEGPPKMQQGTGGEAARAYERWRPRLSSAAALRALHQAAQVGAVLVTPDDPMWPPALDDLGPWAPCALWVRGNLAAVEGDRGAVALVGARASTGYGEHVAIELSAGLCDRGFAIVSGGAYGIDGAAHRAALASDGSTIAFLAGGVDRLYPAGHTELLHAIMADGAVASELPCGASPTRWRFLQRNRLIAACAAATVVVEAGRRSGSLNTAGHAAALGRPLGSVPGPVTSPASAGCHRLLRDYDAVCVTSAEEVAELASGAGFAPAPADSGSERRSPAQTRVLDALGTRTPRTVQDVAARAGLAVSETQAVLGVLDLEGVVHERVDGWLAVPGSST